jgi:hypothetical protein
MKHSAFFEEARAAKKWFLMDKNYILKEAQLVLKEQLVFWTVKYAKEFYQQHYNPLGLVDETVAKIEQADFQDFYLLETFYARLASIYRYKHGETQLQLLFDGATHYEKYKAAWLETYKTWIRELYSEWLTLRAVLEITVFKQHSEHQMRLINQRLQSYIEHHFDVRLYVYKGIVDTHEAA